MLKEFKDFINKGNMLDLAIGIVIGAAFAKFTDAFMSNLINPLVGMITGGADFSNKFIVLKEGETIKGPYADLAAVTKAGGNALGYGAFISAIVSFLITMMVMFIVVKAYNKMKEKSAAQNAADQPAEAPAKAEDIVLLEEIRDLLKK
ncbi:MAG: large conductance mechanosensitive channel protein MscL [Armatimonadota bacterium]